MIKIFIINLHNCCLQLQGQILFWVTVFGSTVYGAAIFPPPHSRAAMVESV